MKKEKKKPLEIFYAVTAYPSQNVKSIYEAKIGGEDGKPSLTKIALSGESKIPVGHVMNNGSMLGIGDHLQLFVPEGGGITSFERDYIKVNTGYHGGYTSPIVALFLKRKDAVICFAQDNLIPKDLRWEKDTIKVLQAVGMDHPYCAPSVFDQRWWLMPPEKWQKKPRAPRKTRALATA